jgi:hypothetical protein
MSYQEIVDLIRNVAIIVNPTGHFMHGRRTDGSLDYNEAFPQIHLMPVRTTWDIQNDNQTNDLVILFWDQDRPETSNLEREAIIAAMDALSDAFIFELYENNPVSISNVSKTPEYRQLAGTASGYGLSFTIISKTICPPTIQTESGPPLLDELGNPINP